MRATSTVRSLRGGPRLRGWRVSGRPRRTKRQQVTRRHLAMGLLADEHSHLAVDPTPGCALGPQPPLHDLSTSPPA